MTRKPGYLAFSLANRFPFFPLGSAPCTSPQILRGPFQASLRHPSQTFSPAHQCSTIVIIAFTYYPAPSHTPLLDSDPKSPPIPTTRAHIVYRTPRLYQTNNFTNTILDLLHSTLFFAALALVVAPGISTC